MKTERLTGGILIILLSGPTFAHDLSERYGDFLGALLHPLSALDHALAFCALGLYAGLRDARWSVIAFVLALLVGTLLPSLTAVSAVPFIGLVNAGSVLVLGALTAFATTLPFTAMVALSISFGLSHGFENGSDLIGISAWHAALGVAAAGIALTVPAAALAHALPPGYPRVAVRVAGSWIAAIGLMVLGLQLRQL